MNNYYIDFKKNNGKLVDKTGNVVVVDMGNDAHAKAISKRQRMLESGVERIRVNAEMKCELKFSCACGTDITIHARNKVEYDLGDGYLDIDPLSFKLDEYNKTCYQCGTEYTLEVNDDDILILKPIK